MSLTCGQVHKNALARAWQATKEIPTPEALAFRRVGVYQQTLIAAAGKENPEFYGASATTSLVGGAADFGDIADPVPVPALIDAIVIGAASGYAGGTEISIVPASDPASGVRPRATLRDLVLRGIGTDLDGVSSVTMYYTRQAPMYGPDDRDTVVELASPHDELLVIDLAEYMLARSPSASSAAVVALLAAMANEKKEALGQFMDYVKNYAPMGSRFGTGI